MYLKIKQSILTLLAFLAFTQVLQADVADFKNTRVCEGSNVLFVSTSVASSGNLISYSWDFNNDGIFGDASGTKVNHLFTSPGNFPVGLRITNSNGTVTTVYKTITVNPVAKASFTTQDICAMDKAVFTDASTLSSGSIAKYKWDFDNDGHFDDSSGAMVSHKFVQAGSYNISHEVVTDSGCVSSFQKTITVNTLPEVDFSFNRTCLYDTTYFLIDAQASNSYISEYHWNFDGDQIYEDTSMSNEAYKSFINYGNYQVSVEVETNKGCKKDTSKVVVIAPRPVLNFTFSNHCERKEIEFDNSFSKAKDYHWEFGDGSASQMYNPTHIYSTHGEYQIKLFGSSAFGCSDSIVKKIQVYPTPKSSFSAQDVCLGNRVEFFNATQSNGVPVKSYNWIFGDGHGDITSNPVHLYDYADSFEVSLIASNIHECRDTFSSYIHVFPNPKVNITSDKAPEICVGDSVKLMVNLGSNMVIWSNGKDENEIKVTEKGKYFALVYDQNGCQGKDSMQVVVHELPELELNTKDTSISKGTSVSLNANGAMTYNWTPRMYLDNPYIGNPTANPLQSIEYEVEGTDQNGCVNSEKVKVEVLNDYLIQVNNMITPNGDGANDIWDLNLAIYEDNEVIIYNRWGTEVFRQKNYQDNWDGSFNGEALPDGTYYYVIQFDNSEKVYSGSLTILR